MPELNSLKKKTISGLFWSFLDLIANQGLQFIIQIILARLLIPKDFGVIGMISIFIALSATLIDSGFSQALIRNKEAKEEDYSTVFNFNLVISIMLYIILYLSADSISIYFNEPRLISILRILSLVIIINSFSIVQRVILTKDIDFKTQANINVISSVISGTVAIICAYNGLGVWSLVIRILTMQLMQAVLLWFKNKWKPKLIFDAGSFKNMFGFGWKLLASGVINTVYTNLYYIIIGKIFAASELGYYTNAQKLNDAVSQTITMSVQRVSYPVLSKLQDDKDRLKQAYRKIIKTVVFINFPLMLGLAAVAKPLIIVLFGYKWSGSVIYFQFLCFAGMMFPLHAINLDILQVKGRSDLFLRLEILKKAVFTVLIIAAIISKSGIMGLIGALVLNSYISYFLNSYYSAELIDYSTKHQLVDILPAFIVSIIMGIVVYASNVFMPNIDIIKLIFETLLGLITYIVISKVINAEGLHEIYKLLSPLIVKLKKIKADRKYKKNK
ncbi:MOP flippase family protein [Clostridium algoriphilum]|uniref:MOP flippase family protein n=1 Tax=Clostridium algoriphilum TaxID=198347 RepID=UPI001CF2BE5F|nr:MOP flippase family protein [Clostridium algoriphilum]MCB2295341.1 MOP flippase family protein [Clostridium algoriphilum]